MAFQSCPSIVKVEINAVYGGKILANVLHAKREAYTEGDVEALADAMASSVSTTYPQLCSAGMTLTDVVVTGLERINDYSFSSLISPNAGTSTGDSMPANQSFSIKLGSALTGKSARGRVYLFPTGSDSFSGVNVLATTYVEQAIAMLAAWKDTMFSAGFTWVVLSRVTGKAQRLVGIGFNITSQTAVNTISDSQRGRLPKGH